MCLLFSGKKKIVRTQQSVNFFFVLTYICIRWGYLQERLQKHIRPTKREAAFWQSVPFVVVVSCRHFVVLDVLAIQRRHSMSRENHNLYFNKTENPFSLQDDKRQMTKPMFTKILTNTYSLMIKTIPNDNFEYP